LLDIQLTYQLFYIFTVGASWFPSITQEGCDAVLPSVIALDLETNGLNAENSVLSICAIKLTVNLNTSKIIQTDQFLRYYYPDEPFNKTAISVNGLTGKKISQLRWQQNADYNNYFRDDVDNFLQFCSGVNCVLVHNADFDLKFIPNIFSKKFCTMKENMEILPVRSWKKWPKLCECAEFYDIQYSLNELHDALNDAKLLIKIFETMMSAGNIFPTIRQRILQFLA